MEFCRACPAFIIIGQSMNAFRRMFLHLMSPIRGGRPYLLAVMMLIMVSLARLMINNSKINKAQQMTATVRANARNILSMIESRLRSAGWDPLNAGLQSVVWDSVPGDGIEEMEIFADLDSDGLTDSLDEQIVIRHATDRLLMRRTNDSTDPFLIVATNITNDADGDGVTEAMFTPIVDPDPTAERILVQITARSPAPDPMTGEFIRYTVRSEVALRKTL